MKSVLLVVIFSFLFSVKTHAQQPTTITKTTFLMTVIIPQGAMLSLPDYLEQTKNIRASTFKVANYGCQSFSITEQEIVNYDIAVSGEFTCYEKNIIDAKVLENAIEARLGFDILLLAPPGGGATINN